MYESKKNRRVGTILALSLLLSVPLFHAACNTGGDSLLDPTGAGVADSNSGAGSTNPGTGTGTGGGTGTGNTQPASAPSPFSAGRFIFSTTTDPIDGFTYTHSGASMEYWVYRPILNVGRSNLAGCELNGKVYAIGGQDLNGALATVEVLDLPGNHVWNVLAPLPTARTELCAASANGRIYALGGFVTGTGPGTGLQTRNDEYNPDTNTWTPKAPVPTARSDSGAASVGGKIYMIGGSTILNNAYVQMNNVDEYDPATDTWTPKAPMHYARQNVAVTVMNGHIFAVGGLGDVGADSAMEEYDPVANAWTTRAAIPHARRSACAFGWNGKVIVYAGIEGGTFIKETEEYDPTFNAWTAREDLPRLRYASGYASIGPSCYCFGGVVPGGSAASYADVGAHEYFAYTVVYPFVKN